MNKFVIIPCPHEATTSYGRGTKHGPAAILKALPHVEEFDEELGFETTAKADIKILKPLPLSSLVPRLLTIFKEGSIPVILGGEHSITPVIVKAAAEQYKNLSVLQLDAHADLRDSFQGKKNSHACVMRRVLEICPAVQAGIRSISKEEWEWAKQTGQIKKIHFAEKLELVEKIEDQLGKNVYITIDVDVFDPSVIPATGTPEPGGMFWYEVLDILSRVCRDKNVIGFDVVELAPRKGDIASDFTIAKLVYKTMGYLTIKP
ncbi:MAG: agmatinase [Candidatus Margulisbacteria bacterium]|nr:agmatinase [Candidatus Margulisiibacteriota bacterium]